jgi:AcrR family transcriptional regulator
MSAWQPRQLRAVETRRRIHDAAMAEMERVGVEGARVADIVAAAGVGWGTFYRYFPTKEDVLLDAAATVAQVFADFCEVGATSGRPIGEVIIGAIWRAASAAPQARPLWEVTFRALAERPGRLSELLAERHVTAPVDVLGQLMDTGQRRGEIRDDHPAALLAAVTLTSIWANALHEGPVGVMTSRLPAPGSGERTSQRSLAAALLVDGLTTAQPPAHHTPPAVPAERIGRKPTPSRRTLTETPPQSTSTPPADTPPTTTKTTRRQPIPVNKASRRTTANKT